ncbi:hypothetical protein [Spiroplasma phoeniceum]|uniref:Uncharacterized protein n=1 Tax=Spiroplasma phoeniceum P40 TaxID=1276259 RepID=A0A345DRL0_9MOLU|nr:hypothetical protein [Spiroplasma phoeniceum]AXF96851.1 hypothetical protein SDAV_001909 [Spiroplasma phoeniceum P40]
MKNIVQNVSFPFAIKGNDFKELSLKALNIKKWIDENGQELAEFIYRHRNQYNTTGYKDVHLKDIPSTLTKIDIVFKEPLDPVKEFKDALNRIHTNIIHFEKYIENHKIEIKNNINQVRIQKQNEFLKEQELKKQELIEKVNSLTPDMGLDIDQIQDEQVRVMEQIEQIDKSLEPKELKKVGINLIKEKLLIKDIEVIGIDDDFLENANQYELKQLIKYLIFDEKLVKNTIKAQWDTNTDNKVVGIKGINIQIKGVK